MIELGEIFSGKNLKGVILDEHKNAKNETLIISAYITEPAIDLIISAGSSRSRVSLFSRVSPHDVLSGATSIDALKKAYNQGFKVFKIEHLHAKMYVFDHERIYLSSANFTSNGLSLHGSGNLEVATRVESSKNNLTFIDEILSAAHELDIEDLDKMAAFIEQQKMNAENVPDISSLDWPEEVWMPDATLFVSDLFWSDPRKELLLSDDSSKHDFALLNVKDFSELEANTHALYSSKPVKWLVRELKDSKDNSASYGYLSKRLHDTLADDPAPYRKTVKELLSNILSYSKVYLKDRIEINRPNHSQVVSLINV